MHSISSNKPHRCIISIEETMQKHADLMKLAAKSPRWLIDEGTATIRMWTMMAAVHCRHLCLGAKHVQNHWIERDNVLARNMCYIVSQNFIEISLYGRC